MEVEPVASTSKIPETSQQVYSVKSGVKQLPVVSLAQANPRRPVLFSPDAKLCFVSAGSSVKIYNATTCQLMSSLTPDFSAGSEREYMHDTTVSSIVLHPTNPLQVIVGSLDGFVRMWDYLEGLLVRTLDIGAPVTNLAAHTSHPGHIYVGTRGESEIRHAARTEEEAVGAPQTLDKSGYSSVVDTGVYRVSLRKNAKPPTTGVKRLLSTRKTLLSLDISPDSNILIAAAGRRVYLLPLADLESGWVTVQDYCQLTAIAIHPTDPLVATGNTEGQIKFHYCLDPAWFADRARVQQNTGEKHVMAPPPASAMLHWHAHPVGAMYFTPNGASLLSGGEEGVMVNWKLRSGGQKDFLPRLGGPIVGLSVTQGTSAAGQEIAVTLSDGTILFIASQNMTVKRSIAGVKWDVSTHATERHTNVSYPLAVQPLTGNLVLPSSHPSAIQFFSPSNDAHLLELEVAPSNRIANRKGDAKPLEPMRVERVAFDPSGRWMATYESWRSPGYITEACLKFWLQGDESLQYTLVTAINRPHKRHMTSMTFCPAAGQPLLLTTGFDGQIKQWSISHIKRSKAPQADLWRCSFQQFFRNRQSFDAAWSPDGTMYATAHSTSVSLWDASSNQLVRNFIAPSTGSSHHVRFAGKDGSVLAVCGRFGVIAWSLLDFEAMLEVDAQLTSVFDQLPSQELKVSEIVPRPKRKVNLNRLLTFDLLSTAEPQAALFPEPIRQMRELAAAPQSQSLLLISTKGDLLMTKSSNEQDRSPATTSSKIQVPISKQSKLFDDIFGPSSAAAFTITPAAAPPRSSSNTAPSMLNEVLAPAAHLLPPLSLVWQDLMPLPSKLVDQAAPDPKQPRAEEGMDGDDVEMTLPDENALPPQELPAGLIASILKA